MADNTTTVQETDFRGCGKEGINGSHVGQWKGEQPYQFVPAINILGSRVTGGGLAPHNGHGYRQMSTSHICNKGECFIYMNKSTANARVPITCSKTCTHTPVGKSSSLERLDTWMINSRATGSRSIETQCWMGPNGHLVQPLHNKGNSQLPAPPSPSVPRVAP